MVVNGGVLGGRHAAPEMFSVGHEDVDRAQIFLGSVKFQTRAEGVPMADQVCKGAAITEYAPPLFDLWRDFPSSIEGITRHLHRQDIIHHSRYLPAFNPLREKE